LAAHLKVVPGGDVVAESNGSEFTFRPKEAGSYRLEAWLTVDGEERPWIYANPIFLDASETTRIKLPAGDLAPNVEVRKDITYAEGAPEAANKHKLHIYVPKDKANFPVRVFIHD